MKQVWLKQFEVEALADFFPPEGSSPHATLARST